MSHRNGLQFEVSSGQQRARTDKRARRIILCEVRFVDRIEPFKQRQVCAKNLHVSKIVHGHSGLRQDVLFAIQQQFDFILDFFRHFSGLCINADAPGKIQRVAELDSIAEGSVHKLIRQFDRLAFQLPGRLRSV